VEHALNRAAIHQLMIVTRKMTVARMTMTRTKANGQPTNNNDDNTTAIKNKNMTGMSME